MSSESDTAILYTLSKVPYGKVCTYGRIAELSGQPGKARHVGYILKHLPYDSEIPWHRIINSQGKLSFPENSPKYLEQVNKLCQEGVTVTNQKISLKLYMWLGE